MCSVISYLGWTLFYPSAGSPPHLQVLLWKSNSDELIHVHEVLEGKPTLLCLIEVSKDLVEGILVPVHHLVELHDFYRDE